MSTVAQSFVTWSDFQRWPERSIHGAQYELHDGEVIEVPPPNPIHKALQLRINDLLKQLAKDIGYVQEERPYRPSPDLQFWIADVAVIAKDDWELYSRPDYPVHAPLILVEVVSPSNTLAKLNRQKLVAMSAGTQEFWIVDPAARTVEVTTLASHKLYQQGNHIESVLGSLPLDDIFVT